MEFKHCSIAGILYLEGSKETLLYVRGHLGVFLFVIKNVGNLLIRFQFVI